MTGISVIQGDVIEVLKSYPDESFTAAFCDPPYGLKFMGKEWDHGVPASPYWAEILRVLKPGAILMAFSGTRTWHRLGVAIEDAGFELFDTMMWLHAQGFPKSHSIGKALDKAAGAKREVIIERNKATHQGGSTYQWSQMINETGDCPITAPATDAAKIWEGYGTSLKPAFEPILCARKPRKATYAQTAMEHGTAALNIDGCRIASAKPYVINTWDDGAKPFGDGAGHPFTGHQQSGRWPANLLLSHTADCIRIGMKKMKQHSGNVSGKEPSHTGDENTSCYGEYNRVAWQRHADADGMETIEVWRCSPDCPVAMLDRQAGQRKSGHMKAGQQRKKSLGKGGYHGNFPDEATAKGTYGDSGGPSRFFYCTKSNKREREVGLRGYFPCLVCGGIDTTHHTDKRGREIPCRRDPHTTVKPLTLCEYLARLIVPPEEYRDKAALLVPFAGVMSEAIGAFLAGWRNITAIDIEKEYCEIGQKRIDWWAAKMKETGLTDPKAILKTYGRKKHE